MRIGYDSGTGKALAIRSTDKVRIYDRLVLAWIVLMILFFVLSNLTRPANYPTIASEIIIPFSIYILSPLKIKHYIALALGITAATLYVDYFLKTGIGQAGTVAERLQKTWEQTPTSVDGERIH